MQLTALPQPLKLAVRFIAVGAILLWLSHAYERVMVEPMLPVFGATLKLIGDDFTILGMDINHEGPNESLRVRADFSHSIYVAGRVLYPMALDPKTAGWMQVNLTLGGVLQYSLLMLMIVLAWPAASVREFACRFGIAAPLIVFLLLIDVPFTILAELWFPVHEDFDSKSFWPLLNWSKFLMGGGGLALAILLAIVAISAGNQLTAGARGIQTT